MNIKAFIPAFDWLPHYNTDLLKGDLSAGLTVGVMLIPQGMAYAMIAGLPPIYGLYASTLPLIIYAVLGTSRQLAVGPVAMVSLLTAAGIGGLAEAGTTTYIALAIALALFVGVIQFLLGAFRLGFLVNFLSHPVISGFTSAAALIIGLSQLKHLLGVKMSGTHHVHEIVSQAIGQFENINWVAFGIGIVGILLIIGIKRVSKAVPGSLLAVVFGILAVWGLGLTDMGVTVVGKVPSGLPAFSLPSFSLGTAQVLLPTAMAIALVSFMESIAVAKAIQAKHKDYKIVANQELIALGAANIGGAFLQGFPVTGGFSRTAVNDQAGARTGMAAVISAALIVLTLLFLTPLFYYLPNAILASIIMVAVFGLIDYKEAFHLWHADRSDFWMLIVTFVTTLALGIEQGIGVGVALSVAVIIYQTTRPHIAVLGRIPGTTFYRNVERFPQLELCEDVLIVRFDAQLYFANLDYFKTSLETLVAQKGTQLKTIIINAESINQIDSSAMQTIDDIVTDFKAAGLCVYFSGVKGPVRDGLVRGHLIDKIGEGNFFMSVQEAMDAYEKKHKTTYSQAHQEVTLQANAR